MAGYLGELRPAIAGLCATLVGIGLARFAYTPLLPALIEGGWFGPADAAYLGAANLVGYLAGAVTARRVIAHVRPTRLVRLIMLVAAATFLACSLRLGFAWFLFWRFLSGLSGGLLMVAVAPTVLAAIPPHLRGRAGGLMFSGVGLGIVGAGTLLPLLLRGGVAAAWLGLGALALLLTALVWRLWPQDAPLPRSATAARRGVEPAVLAVVAVYMLYAVGLVPHMVFFVDFIARGLGWGVSTGAGFWAVYGVGAILGPFAAGWLGDRIGFSRALPVALVLQLGGVLIPLLAPSMLPLTVSALVMGAFTPGMPTLVLGRLTEIASRGDQHGAWGLATTAFAVAQAGCAYGLSWLFARSHGYETLFAVGATAMTAALAVSLLPVGGRRSG
ncbi:MAG: YbfB/YjiJ family MFS transporter [Geminicoccaceae bacterium]